MAKRGEYVDWLKIYQSKLQLTKKGNNYVALCPYHSEKSPSFTIYPSGFYKCYGCGEVGGYKKFIEDFDIKGIEITTKPAQVIQNQSIIAEFSDMPYSVEGAKYWNDYNIPTDFLIKKNVFQVKLAAINGKIWKLPKGAIRYAYYSPDLDQTKFLTINVKKEDKWKSFGIPDRYLWYYHEYENSCCNDLFVNKSVKDCLIFLLLGHCSVAVQSENAPTLLKNAEKINKIATNPIVTWGNDPEAKAQSIIATKQTGWKWLNPQNYFLKQGINDFAEMSKEYGLKIVEKEIEKKLKLWKT